MWISNMMLVKKANRAWWICVDFINLNKASQKDSYSLLKIDKLVDATTQLTMLSLMDAFCNYHKISLHPDDKDKTMFVMDKG